MKILKLIKILIIAAGVVGFMLAFGGIGACDYAAEIGQAEPEGVWVQILVGCALMVPGVVAFAAVRLSEQVEGE